MSMASLFFRIKKYPQGEVTQFAFNVGNRLLLEAIHAVGSSLTVTSVIPTYHRDRLVIYYRVLPSCWTEEWRKFAAVNPIFKKYFTICELKANQVAIVYHYDITHADRYSVH